MIDIYVIRNPTKLSNSVFDRMLKLVNQQKRKNITNFLRIEDAYRTLISEILVRSIICSRLCLKNEEILLVKNKYGKPFLRENDNFHFNISHSGEWIVCAFDTQPIGIDIERIRNIDLEIAKRFFSISEYRYLLTRNEGYERLECFYDLWTLKESYIKARGKGLSIPLNTFSIKINNNKITVQDEYYSNNYFFRQYNLDPFYKLSVCANNNLFPTNIQMKNVNDLIKFFNL